MDKLDRLIIKAKKKKKESELKLTVALIYESPDEPGKWVACGELWNGVKFGTSKCKTDRATCVCDSIGECQEALEQLSEEHPNSDDLVIIVDDLGLEGSDEVKIISVLGQVADEFERNELFNLMINYEKDGVPDEFNKYMQALIEKYRYQVMEMLGYITFDFSWMTTEQLKKIVYDLDVTEPPKKSSLIGGESR